MELGVRASLKLGKPLSPVSSAKERSIFNRVVADRDRVDVSGSGSGCSGSASTGSLLAPQPMGVIFRCF